jgi:hypothetical protein
MDRAAALRRIDAVEQLLRDLRADLATDDDLAAAEIVEVPGQGAWTRKMLEQLLPQVEHLPGVLALFDVAAERAPGSVAYAEVLDRSGLSSQEQSSQHSRLTWTTKRLFNGRRIWPVGWRQATDGTLSYRMPSTVAGWWRAIRT